jgi:hypothetical protein
MTSWVMDDGVVPDALPPSNLTGDGYAACTWIQTSGAPSEKR